MENDSGDLLPGENHVVSELQEHVQKRNFWALVWAQAASVGYGALRTSFLAVIVARYTSSALAISFAVTANRFFQPVLNPFIGRHSDRTRSRHGRRKPFMVVGLIVMGLALSAVPIANNYWLLVGLASFGSIGAAAYRIPRFSVTPEIFGQKRWAAMGVAIGAAGLLPNASMQAFINRTWGRDQELTFVVAGIACVIGAFLLASMMLEPVEMQERHAVDARDRSLRVRLRDIRAQKNLMVLLLAGAIASTGVQGIPPLYVIYAGEVLKVGGETVAAAALIQGIAIAMLASLAIWIGLKVDRHSAGKFCAFTGSALSFVALFPDDIVIISTLGVVGALVGIVVAVNLGTLVVLLFRRETLAEIAGIWSSFTLLGSLLSIYGTGFLVDHYRNYRLIWLFPTVGFATAAMLLRKLDLPERHRHPDINDLKRALHSSFAQGFKRSGREDVVEL